MDSVIKTFLTIFCLLIATFSIVGLCAASFNASNADKYLADCCKALEEGNFQSSVISSCISEADEKGYSLTCKPIDSDGDNITDMVDVTLEYDYVIPYLNASTEKHTIKAYAR